MSKLTFWLIVFVILGLALAVGSATIVHTRTLAPGLVAFLELVERLGDALAIAAIVGGVIEQVIFKKELLDRARDFFIRYFGRLLPEELQRRLRDYLEISLIRSTWDITYDIEHWDGKQGYLRLTTEMKYRMENRSEAPQTYQFRYEVEDSLCPDIAQTSITWIRMLSDAWDENELKKARLVRSERGYQVFRETDVEIPPYKTFGKGIYEFEARSVECFKKSLISPFWALQPVIRSTFRVLYPADVEVFFDVTFGEVEQMTRREDREQSGRKESLWTILKPILPGQGFEVRSNLKHPDKMKQQH